MATAERLVIESMFMIADKDGNDVPFILNSAQLKVDSRLSGRDIIPKARQEGVSSYFLARNLAKCLGKRNTRAVIISHDAESTQRMLHKVYYMIDNIRGPKAELKNSSKNEITFPKTNSMFYIGTAGAKKFGRGDTITDLHCSEVAYWADPKSLLGGLFQAVPKRGNISIESTGNGVGNWYHRACMRAASGKSRFRLHFLDWQSFTEYENELTKAEAQRILDNLSDEFEEAYLIKQFGLTPQKLSWRRDKIEELDFDLNLFRQEYPLTLDECFQSSGYSIFSKVNYAPTKDWIRQDAHLYILKDHPKKSYQYAIGGDVSAGVGKDYSVAEIICLNTMEQVGEYRNDRIAPDVFGQQLERLGGLFNEAYLTIENNNHGIVTLKVLKEHYPYNKLYKKPRTRIGAREEVETITEYGFRTSVKSKPFAIGELRSALANDLVIHSPVLKSELDTFIENENGQMLATKGCFDDTVMSMAVCIVGLTKAILATQPQVMRIVNKYVDPFSLDGIIEELNGRDNKFPISLQVTGDNDEGVNPF